MMFAQYHIIIYLTLCCFSYQVRGQNGTRQNRLTEREPQKLQPTRAGFYERNARKQHKLQGVKPDNLKRPSRQVTEEGETKTKVLSTVHCISCGGRKFQPNFEDLETYAQLSQDVKGLLPFSFTICATVSTPVVESYLNVFTLLGEDGDSFLANEIYLSEDNPNSVFYYYINGAYVSTSRSVPLIFPNQWVRSCLAANTESGLLRWVVNGKLLEETTTETLKENSGQKPKSLAGKLLIGPNKWIAGWTANSNKVTNLNIFTSILTVEKMEKMTSGRAGCVEDGDYLAWQDTEWSLHGEAVMEEVEKEQPCVEEEWVRFFDAGFLQMEDCMRHCQKLGGRAPSVLSKEDWTSLQGLLDDKIYSKGKSKYIWLSVTDAEEEGVWRDFYTKEAMSHDPPFTGNVVNKEENCAQQATSTSWIDWFCTDPDNVNCVCAWKSRPILKLRGLCTSSSIDPFFLPMSLRADATQFVYVGNKGSRISYDESQKGWLLEIANVETGAKSSSKLGSYLLGRHNWMISNDSFDCNEGKPYETRLKLSGCDEDEFTCDDGQCVAMEERCNQVADCRDESDENNCQVLVLKASYNQRVPPITTVSPENKTIVPAQVETSITLMKVVSMKEVEHSIEFQFQITMEWKENRATYFNLKEDISLNALPKDDIERLWLPLIVYDNTDQKETTRLGMGWEWSTGVNVKKEGGFVRAGLDSADEIEVFKGNENSLRMQQTYTRNFQCVYQLTKYPFDTQVQVKRVGFIFYVLLFQGVYH